MNNVAWFRVMKARDQYVNVWILIDNHSISTDDGRRRQRTEKTEICSHSADLKLPL